MTYVERQTIAQERTAVAVERLADAIEKLAGDLDAVVANPPAPLRMLGLGRKKGPQL